MNDKIELSEVLEQDPKAMLNWARNVVNKVELSEAEKAISTEVNGFVKDAWKYGSTTAKESIAQLVGKIIEPEVFFEPNEVLSQIFNDNTYGEFDLVRITHSPKNTLVARQSAIATGNVDKSYIDVSAGTVWEENLQIETELKMSDLRRDGALGIAQLTVFAIQEFNRSKFKAVLSYIDNLIVNGGDNYIACTGTLTKTAVDDFTGYLDDHCYTGRAEVIALSDKMRELITAAGIEDFYSRDMQNELNDTGMLAVYRNNLLVPIKTGEKNGKGETLLPKDRLFGFSGVIGEMYTKGEMRSLVTNENNKEVISLKFTNVQFGIFVDKPEKVAKIVIS